MLASNLDSNVIIQALLLSYKNQWNCAICIQKNAFDYPNKNHLSALNSNNLKQEQL